MLIDQALITAFRGLAKTFFDGNRGANYSVFRLKMNCTNANGGYGAHPSPVEPVCLANEGNRCWFMALSWRACDLG
jgi:hypothetical protein